MKGKGKSIPQDSDESNELEDSFDGDDSISLSDSVSEESLESNDRSPAGSVTIPASPNASPMAADIPSNEKRILPGDKTSSNRIPIEAVPTKFARKVQPVVTIIRKPCRTSNLKVTANEQLATPLGSEPPEESTIGAKRSLRVTTLERRVQQITQAVSQKLQGEQKGQSSGRKSPRKR